MPLMGGMYVGLSGLRTSQNALNTTAHNMTNADTDGYTRQQVMLGTALYNTIAINSRAVAKQQIGLGATYTKTRQVRDAFLDATYRTEAGRQSFYEVSSTTLSTIEDIFGELNDDNAFSNTMDDLWTAVQELAKDPTSSVTQGLFVQQASAFVNNATDIYNGLTNYQDSLNEQVKQKVDQINEYGKQLKQLNDEICNIEKGGFEEANDLRDSRNLILDKLSQLAKITYSEDSYGNITVNLEGEDFVKGEVVYEIGLYQEAGTSFYTPFWTQNATYTVDEDGNKHYKIDNAKVFDMTKEISSDKDTDIGSLKSTLASRGSKRANYEDVAEGNYTAEISQSVIMNTMAEFDQLVHNVTTKINQILADASDSDSKYLCNEDGTPIQIFETISDDNMTLGNIRINQTLKQTPSLLGFVKKDGSTDYDTVQKLEQAFQDTSYTLNPNVKTPCSFTTYYNALISQIANTGSVFNNVITSQQSTVNATDTARQMVAGVSTEEELANMVKYQNAYNASSRYINVIDQMIEHVINALGS